MFNKASIRLYTKQVAAIKYSFIATLVIGVVTSLVNTVQPLLLKSLFDNINSISAYQILVILAFLLLFTFLSALEGYLQNTIGNKIIANGRRQITRQIQYIDHESLIIDYRRVISRFVLPPFVMAFSRNFLPDCGQNPAQMSGTRSNTPDAIE
ncbi:hypothetical protein HMPREF0574_1490 [Mobiluncus curtisii subsp. curtisii ATCC 35241]|nr:hypothetical protein HMPREF0574_1490 [Mobiluncus curtisii subsp. curtisii ATCC 35241]STY76838.1 Uncharacterised protein [Mobiluncus curtisii subsp. curtisii]